jgi:beta-lactamase class A
MVKAFPGVAGIFVKDLEEGHSLAVHAEELFPVASTIKIHVLVQLLLLAEQRELDLEQRIALTPGLHVPGSGVISYLEGEVELSILDLAILMIIVSDNTATNLCIDLAGIEATNALLDKLGLQKTRLRRKMQDNEAIAKSKENVSTPRELVALLELLYQGKPTSGVAEQALAILKKPKKALFSRVIPPIPLANKGGAMERVRCDAGLVYLPRRPYAIAVATSYGLGTHEEQERFIVDLTTLVHQTMAVLDSTSDYGQGIPVKRSL